MNNETDKKIFCTPIFLRPNKNNKSRKITSARQQESSDDPSADCGQRHQPLMSALRTADPTRVNSGGSFFSVLPFEFERNSIAAIIYQHLKSKFYYYNRFGIRLIKKNGIVTSL